jgi:hypothetical protein
VTADQGGVDFSAEVIGVSHGNSIATWSATSTVPQVDIAVELKGVFILESSDDGLCTELREWCHAR